MDAKNLIIQTLRSIGLSGNEAKIYITTWSIGNNPASTIAKVGDINRSCCYTILNNLIQKGLIQKNTKNNISYFSAISPRYLLELLTNKKNDINIKINNLQKLNKNWGEKTQ